MRTQLLVVGAFNQVGTSLWQVWRPELVPKSRVALKIENQALCTQSWRSLQLMAKQARGAIHFSRRTCKHERAGSKALVSYLQQNSISENSILCHLGAPACIESGRAFTFSQGSFLRTSFSDVWMLTSPYKPVHYRRHGCILHEKAQFVKSSLSIKRRQVLTGKVPVSLFERLKRTSLMPFSKNVVPW